MLTLNAAPMVQLTQETRPCFVEPDIEICVPCRQLDTYLPLIKAPTQKENSGIAAFATAALQIDDALMQQICGLCFSPESDDCECLLRFGRSIGAAETYPLIETDYCMRLGHNVTVDTCCVLGVCTKQVFAYCPQLCPVCNVVTLDVCNNEDDFLMYKKIVLYKAKWFHMPPTRKNLTDALIDWFGAGAYVVQGNANIIYWSLGRAPTPEELQIMPFITTMLPLYDLVDLIFTEEATL